MSKRNSDGDVLANRLSLGLAKNQKLLASWMGTQPAEQTTDDSSKTEEEDTELEQHFFAHDRLGVGGILPKDIANGSFTKRTLTSNDKLLEQLIGKKKAKAHLAAKQHAERLGAQPQHKHGRREAAKQEESDDEEEGRAAAFKSKRRKVVTSKPAPVSDEEEAGEEEPRVPITQEPSQDDQEQEDASVVQISKEDDNKDTDIVPAPPKPKSIPSRGRAKPTSYLDELLAERSKKKKNKSKNKVLVES